MDLSNLETAEIAEALGMWQLRCMAAEKRLAEIEQRASDELAARRGATHDEEGPPSA